MRQWERLTLAGECEFYVRVSIFIRKGVRTGIPTFLPPTLGSFSFRARHNDTLQGLGIFGRDSPKGERQSGGPFFKRVFFIFEFKGLRDLL